MTKMFGDYLPISVFLKVNLIEGIWMKTYPSESMERSTEHVSRLLYKKRDVKQ